MIVGGKCSSTMEVVSSMQLTERKGHFQNLELPSPDVLIFSDSRNFARQTLAESTKFG